MSGTSESVKKGWNQTRRIKARRKWANSNNPRWNSGRMISTQGYILVRMPDHPAADPRGYVLEHRFIVEQKLGRYLQSSEHIDHINCNKQDNRLENLQIVTNSQNKKLDLERNGHPMLGKKLSKESIEKMRLSKIGKKASLATRRKLSLIHKKIWFERKQSCL